MEDTQAELAKKTENYQTSTIQNRNHPEDIKLSTLTKFAKALGSKVELAIQ